MSTTQPTTTASGFVPVGDVELWFEQRGEGPDVLLIGGLTDPAESWEPQLADLSDRYRVTAFDNRGAGRSPAVPDDFTVADFADDTAALARALGIGSAHVAGFSGGSLIGQELALRHPGLVRSLVLQSTWAGWDPFLDAIAETWRPLVEHAPDDRTLLEWFLTWVYTPRAHNDGTVAAIIDEALQFPHPQPREQFLAQLAAFRRHDTLDRLHQITAPTLVLAGGADLMIRTELQRRVADGIPGARFHVLDGEAHQPFQEIPDEWNALVHTFWSEI